jgi:excisionase family DNA binding protein
MPKSQETNGVGTLSRRPPSNALPAFEVVPASEADHPVQKNAGSSEHGVLTLKQAAAYLQISKAHLCNVIAGKVSSVPKLRSVRIGRRILMKREWIEEWLERS